MSGNGANNAAAAAAGGDKTELGFGTRGIHAGQSFEPGTNAVIPSIGLSTTFAQPAPGEPVDGFEYSRSKNPTRLALERNVASLEGVRFGACFASGSSATATILGMLEQGAHIISTDDVYGGTQRYFNKVASKFGITTTFVDFSDPKVYEKDGPLEAAFTPTTRLVWAESPTNPLLKIADLQRTAEIAHQHGALLVVDNTFMSPYFQNPAALGADIVVHSMTKYLNGHSDVVMGFVGTNEPKLAEQITFLQNGMGAVPSPFDCYLVLRSTKTLHLRMREHQRNASAVAKFLEGHPKVEKTIYPGLKSHPQYEIACKQMSGFGGMVSAVIKGGVKGSSDFLKALKVFTLAESLGGVESLAEHPALMTHASVAPETRAKLGIADGLVRLSVGVEDTADLLADLENALSKVEA